MPTWIRVRDHDTGHEFDLNERAALAAIERGEAQRVAGHDDHGGPDAYPRPAKHFVTKDGVAVRRPSTDAESAADQQEDQ